MFGSNRKDAVFFDAFAAHAGTSLEASRLLVEMIAQLRCQEAELTYIADTKTGAGARLAGERIKEIAKAIKEKETAGDTITHETVKRLHETWITPLDRYDIHQLISRMDDVLDSIEASSDQIVLFDVHVCVVEAKELAGTLVQSCEAIKKATSLLRDMKNAKEILSLCVEVNRLENVADQFYRKGIAGLFRAGNDPLAVMKWRDIFESLESAADNCEDVANVIEGVVLEYA
jgi:uncharacterized protein